LIFLDVDCIPGRDLVAAYAQSNPAALACGPVRYLAENWQRRCGDQTDRELRAVSVEHVARPAPEHDHYGSDYDLFWSLSFGVTSALFDQVGGFDESFVGYGGEDTDFARSAEMIGVPLQWLRNGCAYHQWHPSSSPPTEHVESIVANARYFHRKWGEWPMRGWLDQFEDAGLIARSPHGIDLTPMTE